MNKNVNFKDLTNQTFSYLTVLQIDEAKTTSRHTYWICQCDCGKTRSLASYQLTSGKVTSCGCHNKGRHPFKLPQKLKRIYSIYSAMLARCNNPKNISYKSYGMKGIKVCNEWENDFNSFVLWSYANGYNDSLSIDRKDNSKGYSPDNCRWIPLHEQQKNRTTNVFYTHNGETHIMSEWCKILDFSQTLAKSRRKFAKKYGIEPTFEYVFAPAKFHREKLT